MSCSLIAILKELVKLTIIINALVATIEGLLTVGVRLHLSHFTVFKTRFELHN